MCVPDAWLCHAGEVDWEPEEGELAGPRGEGQAVRESLRGTRVMWMENDLWSTLCTSTETDAGARRRSRGTVDGSTPSVAPSPGVTAARPDPPRRTTGDGSGTCIGGGPGSLGVYGAVERGVREDGATGGGAVAGQAAAVLHEHAGVDKRMHALLEVARRMELQESGVAIGGMGDVKATTETAMVPEEVSMVAPDRGIHEPRQVRRSSASRSSEAGKAGSEVIAGGGVAAWESRVEEVEVESSVEESPAAMMWQPHFVCAAEISRGEGAVSLQGAGIPEGVRVQAGLPEPPTAAEEAGRASAGHLGAIGGQSAPGSLSPKLSAGDLKAGGSSVEVAPVMEERLTVESLGEVIELPMVINPLPLMQYYSDAEFVARSEVE